MRRGDLYLKRRPEGDPKKYRCYVVVSRQALVDSTFSTVVCAPIFTRGEGLGSQVAVGPSDGLKHPSWVFCDNLVSIPKSELTHFVGSLPAAGLADLDRALKVALGLR